MTGFSGVPGLFQQGTLAWLFLFEVRNGEAIFPLRRSVLPFQRYLIFKDQGVVELKPDSGAVHGLGRMILTRDRSLQNSSWDLDVTEWVCDRTSH